MADGIIATAGIGQHDAFRHIVGNRLPDLIVGNLRIGPEGNVSGNACFSAPLFIFSQGSGR
jgi:hypothetical protein